MQIYNLSASIIRARAYACPHHSLCYFFSMFLPALLAFMIGHTVVLIGVIKCATGLKRKDMTSSEYTRTTGCFLLVQGEKDVKVKRSRCRKCLVNRTICKKSYFPVVLMWLVRQAQVHMAGAL